MAGPLRSLTRAQGTQIRQLLQDRALRQAEGAFVMEGAHACQDLIRLYPDQILSLVLTAEYLQREGPEARAARAVVAAPQWLCEPSVLAKLSEVEAPQGLLAVVRQPQWREADLWTQSDLLGVYGERLQDPANVGTIIRTAAALNLTGVWLSHESVDCFHPKVVRATAGAIMAIPVFQGVPVTTLTQQGGAVYAAVVASSGAVPLHTLPNRSPRAVIALGNESRGLTAATADEAHVRFTIPLARGVESLNVAATFAMAAYYLRALPFQR